MRRLVLALAVLAGCDWTSRPMLPDTEQDGAMYVPDSGRVQADTGAAFSDVAGPIDVWAPSDVLAPPWADSSIPASDAGVSGDGAAGEVCSDRTGDGGADATTRCDGGALDASPDAADGGADAGDGAADAGDGASGPSDAGDGAGGMDAADAVADR